MNAGIGRYLADFLKWPIFTFGLIYSLSFLIACLVRDMGRAGILSVGAALGVYFLPVVIPSLAWLSVLNLMQENLQISAHLGKYLGFVGTMIGCSVAAVVLGEIAVDRGWYLQVG